jgi:hypothetical protein
MTPLGQRLMSEVKAQKLAIISEIVADWSNDDVEMFGTLFDRYISGFEAVFQARMKDVAEDG